MLLQRIMITGYKPHELGIFNDKHPGIVIIKKALEAHLRTLLDEGLEWVIISGQQGVETWSAEVVLMLKRISTFKIRRDHTFLEQEKIGKIIKRKVSSINCPS